MRRGDPRPHPRHPLSCHLTILAPAARTGRLIPGSARRASGRLPRWRLPLRRWRAAAFLHRGKAGSRPSGYCGCLLLERLLPVSAYEPAAELSRRIALSRHTDRLRQHRRRRERPRGSRIPTGTGRASDDGRRSPRRSRAGRRSVSALRTRCRRESTPTAARGRPHSRARRTARRPQTPARLPGRGGQPPRSASAPTSRSG